MPVSIFMHWFLQRCLKMKHFTYDTIRKNGMCLVKLTILYFNDNHSFNKHWLLRMPRHVCRCPLKSILPFKVIVIEILFNKHKTQMPQRWKRYLQSVSILSCIPNVSVWKHWPKLQQIKWHIILLLYLNSEMKCNLTQQC